jgi:pimeloyl-ACP methyl ester carboxylesterase
MGPLFRHVGSHFVVRDMDAIREALGEERLNYLGLSYGTRLGALYAQTFPERTRAMVLDAPVGPVSSLTELIDAQVPALVGAVADFFDACDAGELSSNCSRRAKRKTAKSHGPLAFAAVRCPGVDDRGGVGVRWRTVGGFAARACNSIRAEMRGDQRPIKFDSGGPRRSGATLLR